jgi:phosphatidylglycerol:prolipoprotein diacylglycerol transferase
MNLVPLPLIDSTSIYLLNVPIKWYSLSYIISIIISYKYALYIIKSKKTPIIKNEISLFYTYIFISTVIIVGSRLGYILIYKPNILFANKMEIIFLWKGGMSFYGGLILTSIILLIYKKRNLLHISDILLIILLPGIFFVRITNFINSEHMGYITETNWSIILPNSNFCTRHPSQIYECIFEGIILLIITNIIVLKTKILMTQPGITTIIFLISYSIIRITIGYIRETEIKIGLLHQIISLEQIIYSIVLIIGVIIIVKKKKYSSKRFFCRTD